jgi:hypothetical protein
MKIINVIKSPKKNKRFQAMVKTDDYDVYNQRIYKKIDFGDKLGNTFIDHHNEQKKINYWKRHYNNPRERPFLEHLIMSPALLSGYLLWGESTDMRENIVILNNILSEA